MALESADPAQDPRLSDPGLRGILGDPLDMDYWQAATGGLAAPDPALERQLACDIIALRADAVPVETLRRLRGPMLSRAAATLRGAAYPQREGPEAAAVTLQNARRPWRGFFQLEVLDYVHRLFRGGMSAPVTREVFVMTDAVTVLPYDPESDLLLLVEQIRPGPLLRGETQPWLIEAVAGRVDAGETPEEAARRETQEEAGLDLAALLPVAEFYPSPGAVTEYIYSYVGLVRLQPRAPELHGLASEGEDIRSHVLPMEAALQMLREGRLRNGPLVTSLLWLERERPRLRAAATGI